MVKLSKNALLLINYFAGEVSVLELDDLCKKSNLSNDEFNKALQELQRENIIILTMDKLHFDEPYFVPTLKLSGKLFLEAKKANSK